MQRRVRLPRWESGEAVIPAGCRFDAAAADRAAHFFNTHLRHMKRDGTGSRFPGRSATSGRSSGACTRTAAVSRQVQIGEAAGIAVKLLFADDKRGAEIYGGAADRDQAAMVFYVS